MHRPPPRADDLVGMELAIAQARLAAAAGEIPVGAVLMRGSEVLAAAHNRTVAAESALAHAELAVLQSCRAADRLHDATLYVTLEPCSMCAGAIVLAKVGRVVFGALEPKSGMAGSVLDLLREPRLNHRCEVVSGVREAECGALLRAFFEARRGS